MCSKVCTECKTLKPLSEFYKNCKSPDLHTAKCSVCIKHRTRERYQATPEFFRKMVYKERAESVKVNYKAFVERNPSYNLEYQRTWQALQVATLGDAYIKKSLEFPPNCPQSLIEVKRLQLKIHRKLNETHI